jgi:hypothetical protein
MKINDLRAWDGPLYSETCDPRVQQKVQQRLDELYVRDGRYRPDHPNHASYTGLFAKYQEEFSNDN